MKYLLGYEFKIKNNKFFLASTITHNYGLN